MSKVNLKQPPGATGQIWEPCSCGTEPVWMPFMVCAGCWPRERPKDPPAAEIAQPIAGSGSQP